MERRLNTTHSPSVLPRRLSRNPADRAGKRWRWPRRNLKVSHFTLKFRVKLARRFTQSLDDFWMLPGHIGDFGQITSKIIQRRLRPQAVLTGKKLRLMREPQARQP